MSFFSDLSLRRKLFLVFGMSIFFIAALIAVGVFHMLWMKSSAMEVYTETVVEAQNILKVRAGMEQSRRSLLQMLLEKDRARQQAAFASLNEATKLVDNGIALLQAEGLDNHVADELWNLRRTWEYFKYTRDTEIVPRLLSGKRDEALWLALNLQEQRFKEFTALSEKLISHSNAEAADDQELITVKFERMILMYAVISIAGFIVAVLAIVFISKDIGGRFSKVLEAIDRFHAGERLVKVDLDGKDEVGKLRDAMNRLFEQVHEDRIAQEQYMGIINWEKADKEKKRAELEKSKEMFRNLVETTSDWVWEVDERGVYTYASPKVFDILGYQPSEVVGRTPFELMPKEESERVRMLFLELVKSSSPIVNLENRNIHKDGHEVVLETNGTPYYDHEGYFAGYRGIDRDITQRKKAEDEKASLARQLTQTEKLASIGQLAAGVAHEINNPLGYVRSNLKTLSEYMDCFKALIDLYGQLSTALEKGDFRAAAGLRQDIERLKKEADLEFTINDAGQILVDSNDGISRISTIVKGLKDFSRAGGGETICQDLNVCLSDALRIGGHELKNRAEVKPDLCDGATVRCRPEQMTQVFLNIIVNAAQAVGENGRIALHTYKVNGSAIVEISDNGPGMSEDVKKRAFDPFFTTKPVGKGTGLGLSIAYNIVKEHGGTLDIESQPGKGAKFRIKLPLALDTASAA